MKSILQFQRSFATILFILFFHYLWKSELAGINLVLTEVLLLVYVWHKHGVKRSSAALLNLGLFVGSSIGFLLHGSSWSIFVNALSFTLLCAQPFSHSNNLLESLIQALLRSIPFLHDAQTVAPEAKHSNQFKWSFIVIPGLLIVSFSALYANAIPSFASFIGDFFKLFPRLDVESILLLAFGFLLALYCWRGPLFPIPKLSMWLNKEQQERVKSMTDKSLNRRLLHEYHTFSIALVSLILLISLAIFFDILDLSRKDWNYETYERVQNGVHSGTAALVIAIIASAFLAVYVFSGNLQFFSPQSTLKKLTYAWLSLNAVLCLTLAYRSIGYIQVYNLAYKRIAILVFIVCALFGLYTVYIKIAKTKSVSYVIRHNLHLVLVCCGLSTLPNWDKIIVNYNLDHPEAYLDYDFIFSRDLNTVIPHMERPELKQIILGNSPNYRSAYNRYGSITLYEYLEKRKVDEKLALERLTWKSMYLSRYRLAQYLDNGK